MRKAVSWLLVSMVLVMLAGFGMTQQRVLRLDHAAPGQLDPHKANDYVGGVLAFNLYDTLVMPDPRGGVRPHLATRWELSNEGRTYTFTLRTGVRFHDGTVVQADDVVFSYERLMAINQGFAFLFRGWVTSVRAVNPTTVEFNLSAPFAPFLATLVRLPIVNKDLVLRNIRPGDFGARGDYGQAFLSRTSAGSGAYRVASHNPNALTVLQRFEGYFLGFAARAPEIVRIRYSLPSPTLRTLMARGEHEVSSQWHPHDVLRALVARPDIDPITEGGSGSLLFKLNTQRAPTDDVHFRRAMALVFDYRALHGTLRIAEGIYTGVPARGPLPAGVPGHDATLPFPRRDLAAAREALARSRYANQLHNIVIDKVWVAEVPAQEKWALLFQQNMAELGVRVNITRVPWGTLTERFVRPETTPNVYPLFTGLAYPDPDGLLFIKYHSRSAGTFWSGSWLNDPQVDRLLDEARTITDHARRMELYQQVQRRLVYLQTDIFIADNLAVFARRANVRVPSLEERGNAVATTGANWLFRLIEVN